MYMTTGGHQAGGTGNCRARHIIVSHLHGGLVLPGLLRGEELPQDDAKAVDVALLVVALRSPEAVCFITVLTGEQVLCSNTGLGSRTSAALLAHGMPLCKMHQPQNRRTDAHQNTWL